MEEQIVGLIEWVSFLYTNYNIITITFHIKKNFYFLLKKINTFSLSKAVETPEDLNDGVALYEIMAEM